MCKFANVTDHKDASMTIRIVILSNWHIATLLIYKSHQILNQAETDCRAATVQEWQPVFRKGEITNYCCHCQHHE